MREFFRGWKRKAGCVTLVMALVLTAFWVRGQFTSDWIAISFGGRDVRIRSWKGWLVLIRTVDSLNLHNPLICWGSETLPIERRPMRSPSTTSYRVDEVPILLISIPLTFLSAYLLLSKPRPVKQTLIGDH